MEPGPPALVAWSLSSWITRESPVWYFLLKLSASRRFSGKESTCNAGDVGLIPGLGRSCGEGNGNPLQYSCLGNPMDRGAWRATSPRGHRGVGHD